MSYSILIVGPQPPAIGGIATIISLLKAELSCEEGNVSFINSTKPQGAFAQRFFPIFLLTKIAASCLRSRRCRVLLFSGAYKSFWEKAAWTIIAKMFGARVYVVMVDGNFPSFYLKLSVLAKFTARLVMKFAIVVGQSPRWGEYYRTIFPSSQIQLISGGVDTAFFTPAEKSPDYSSNDKVSILFVGWLIEAKGIYDLLRAARNLKDKNKNFCIEFVGPLLGDMDAFQRAIGELDVEDCVSVVGPINSRNLLRDKYCAADIFVFPSHFEGFPVSLLEALACGLPCVGTNVGGIPDIIRNGQCGYVVEKKSPHMISNALCELIDNVSLRIQFGNNARLRAEQNYSLKQCVESYKKLLAGYN